MLLISEVRVSAARLSDVTLNLRAGPSFYFAGVMTDFAESLRRANEVPPLP